MANASSTSPSPWCFAAGDGRHLALRVQVANGCDFLRQSGGGNGGGNGLNAAGAALVAAQCCASLCLLALLSVQLHFLTAELRKGCRRPEEQTPGQPRRAGATYRTERDCTERTRDAERANGLVCLSWAALAAISFCMFVFCLDPSMWGFFPTVLTTACNVIALLGVCIFMFFVQYLVPHVRNQRSAVRLKFLLLLQGLVIPPAITSMFVLGVTDVNDPTSLASFAEIFDLFQVTMAIVLVCNAVMLLRIGFHCRRGVCRPFELCGATNRKNRRQSGYWNVYGTPSSSVIVATLDRNSTLSRMSRDPNAPKCLRRVTGCCVKQVAPYRLGLLGVTLLLALISGTTRYFAPKQWERTTKFVVRFVGFYVISTPAFLGIVTWFLHTIFTRRTHRDVGSVLMSAHIRRERANSSAKSMSSQTATAHSPWGDSDSDEDDSDKSSDEDNERTSCVELHLVSSVSGLELESVLAANREKYGTPRSSATSGKSTQIARTGTPPSPSPRSPDKNKRRSADKGVKSFTKRSSAAALKRRSIMASEVALGMRNMHMHQMHSNSPRNEAKDSTDGIDVHSRRVSSASKSRGGRKVARKRSESAHKRRSIMASEVALGMRNAHMHHIHSSPGPLGSKAGSMGGGIGSGGVKKEPSSGEKKRSSAALRRKVVLGTRKSSRHSIQGASSMPQLAHATRTSPGDRSTRGMIPPGRHAPSIPEQSACLDEAVLAVTKHDKDHDKDHDEDCGKDRNKDHDEDRDKDHDANKTREGGKRAFIPTTSKTTTVASKQSTTVSRVRQSKRSNAGFVLKTHANASAPLKISRTASDDNSNDSRRRRRRHSKAPIAARQSALTAGVNPSRHNDDEIELATRDAGGGAAATASDPNSVTVHEFVENPMMTAKAHSQSSAAEKKEGLRLKSSGKENGTNIVDVPRGTVGSDESGIGEEKEFFDDEDDISDAIETWADQMDGMSYVWFLFLALYRGVIVVAIVLCGASLLRIAFDARWDGICSSHHLHNATPSALSKCEEFGYNVSSWTNTNTSAGSMEHANGSDDKHWVTGIYITLMQVAMSLAGLQVCRDNLPLTAARGGMVDIPWWIIILVPATCLLCQASLSMFIYTQFEPLTSLITVDNAPLVLNILDGLLWLTRVALPWAYCMIWMRPLQRLLAAFQADASEFAQNGAQVLSHVLSKRALIMYALPFTVAWMGLITYRTANDSLSHIKLGALVVCFFIPGIIFFWRAQQKQIFGIGPGIPYCIILIIVMSGWPSGLLLITNVLLRQSNIYDACTEGTAGTDMQTVSVAECEAAGIWNTTTACGGARAGTNSSIRVQNPNLDVITCLMFDGKVRYMLPYYIIVRLEISAVFNWLKLLVRIAHGDEKHGYQLSSRLLWPFFLITDITLMMLFLEFNPLDVEFCMLNLLFSTVQMMKDGGFLAMTQWKVYRGIVASLRNMLRCCKASTVLTHQQRLLTERAARQKYYFSEWTKLQRTWCTETLTSESELLAPLVVFVMVSLDLSIAGVSSRKTPPPGTRTMLHLDTSNEAAWNGWKMPLSILCVLTTRLFISQMSTIVWSWRLHEFSVRYRKCVASGEIDEMDELDERHFGLTTTQTRYRATMWHKHAVFFVATTAPIILYGV